MNMYEIIKKKREGNELSKEEINFFIENYTNGSIPDYQASALLMAIFFKKMSKEETVNLTEAMLRSGEEIDLTSIEGIKVDKHSTGGVGDKTTLVLGPMVAACGLPVAKMSGRGLGHTGGTLDKLESIEGLDISLSKEKFISNVNRIKLAVAGQTANIAPADKKLYSLRDVTATVDNTSLIASSIMSKKLASGSDAIVLDVKVGSGAFMKDLDSAFELAKEMVDIGIGMDRDTIAIISDMDEPLGYAIGNSLEVKEAINTLKGRGPKDLLELTLALGSRLLLLGKRVESIEEGYQLLNKVIDDGSAFDKFKEFITAQGGNSHQVDNPNLLPKAEQILELKADEAGYISEMNAEEIGRCALILGAGRETKESQIDMSAGIILNKKKYDKVSTGETIAFLHGNSDKKLKEAAKRMKNIVKISEKSNDNKQLIYGIVDKDGIKRI
ncbi:pyrimidine-nucleoside phosphorylase [Clostridium sp. D2Q-11]|uniref:Pyrimidine-nucleoside phosphorylase n=1 Tax=Anaeromonas frigoriresistens TaxID=2683708 RepID=A0A942UYJ3_9FIRM|nr:pyrimidine-nucleoside phosphorylase [Anaeromonas frigoriresistens]MBS4539965.1 pyrimidine-nucleoside phosphorylase [Anaeromonas frigoriresistens]